MVEKGIGLLRGDVELHVSQHQWENHRHGRDSRYNSVALHGVMHSESPTTLLPWENHRHGRDSRYNSVALHGVMHSESPTTSGTVGL